MSNCLRQSTASQSRSIGPFVSDSDFITAATGLTIANTDIKLIVNGAASANKSSGGGTHRANGNYGVTFDATDTATVGEMDVSVKVAGALQVKARFTVVEEAIYDALFAAGAARIDANVTYWEGADLTAAGVFPRLGIPDQGTAAAAGSASVTLRAAAPYTADTTPVGLTIMVKGSTQGYWQTRQITAYVASTQVATVDAWTVQPTGTLLYEIFATAPISSSTVLTVNLGKINNSTTAAVNAQKAFDGTGGVTLSANLAGNVTGSVASVTSTVAANLVSIDGDSISETGIPSDGSGKYTT